MARRLFNGNEFSEDGWPYVDQGSCTWATIPGTSVTLQIQNGPPLAVLRAAAADFNAYVEPLRDPDSACWTEGNSVATSNHPGGTAMDLNWDGHAFQVRGTFNAAQMSVISEIEAFYEGNLFWAGRWGSPVDEMHWQMGYNTYDQDNDRPFPKVNDFIARKIRADGFSTLRRGNAVVLSAKDLHALDILHEGQRRGITERGLKIALATALVESNITIYANERVPESMAIPHEAVGSDAYSVGIFQQQVRDTGNGWWWGDAATCMDPTSSAGLFFDRLARLDYNGSNSPGSYAQAVQSSAYPDRYDERFGEAEQLYNRLTNLGEDEFLMALSADEQRELLNLMRWAFAPDNGEFRKLFSDQNMYRTSNNRNGTAVQKVIDSATFGWEDRVESSAYRGEPWAIELLAQAVAGTLAGVIKPDGTPDQFLVNHASAVLGDLETNYPSVLQNYLALKGARQ